MNCCGGIWCPEDTGEYGHAVSSRPKAGFNPLRRNPAQRVDGHRMELPNKFFESVRAKPRMIGLAGGRENGTHECIIGACTEGIFRLGLVMHRAANTGSITERRARLLDRRTVASCVKVEAQLAGHFQVTVYRDARHAEALKCSAERLGMVSKRCRGGLMISKMDPEPTGARCLQNGIAPVGAGEAIGH